MNVDNMRTLADAIEADGGEHFNMRSFFSGIEGNTDLRSGCGTTACVAGWAVFLFCKDKRPHREGIKAQEALGLTDWEADQLFFYKGPGCADYDDTSMAQAVAKIRRMADEHERKEAAP